MQSLYKHIHLCTCAETCLRCVYGVCLHLQTSLHILLYLLVSKSLSTVVSAVALLGAHLRVWAPERVSCSTSVHFERRAFLQEACVPCPHGAGNRATSALGIPVVAGVAKLPVAAAVAMLRSVHSSHLWRLRLQHRYHTHTSFVCRRDKGKGNDANDDYSNDAAWHPAPSRAFHFGTPREGSTPAKKGTSKSRLLFCRTAHGELCVSGISWCKLASVGARARVMLNDCVA